MKYKIEVDLNDGKNNAPPFEETVKIPYDLRDILGELCNDYGEPFGVGTTMTITRIA